MSGHFINHLHSPIERQIQQNNHERMMAMPANEKGVYLAQQRDLAYRARGALMDTAHRHDSPAPDLPERHTPMDPADQQHPDDEVLDVLGKVDAGTAAFAWTLATRIATSQDPTTLWAKARGDETPPGESPRQDQPDEPTTTDQDTGDATWFPPSWMN